MNYSYWLSNIPGIGIRSRNRLIAAAGTAQEVYGMTEKQILAVGGITRKQAGRIAESRNWDYETPFEKMMERGILFVSREDAAFPEKLRNIPDAPYSLYYKGSLPGKKKTAAIVGARMCSPYGHTVAHKIGRIFAESGTAVVSGMADGIDADGHWGALAGGGETYAVLGCGVDVCYPAANRELAQQIACHGGILSEYPPGTRPAAPLFPARNRIISGLSDLIVVVEAKKRSGSLITADYALEQGKDIYAVPGRLYDQLSEGCNGLIRQGAGMISDLEEFRAELALCGIGGRNTQELQKLSLEKDEKLVYSCLSLQPKGIEEIMAETGFSVPDAAKALVGLMQKDLISESGKNKYIRQIE